MTSKSHWIPAAGISLALVASVGTGAQAQTTQLLSYAAKFVCGERGSDRGVVRGRYETSVNIHNPHYVEVVAQKKAVIAWPQSAPPGPISKFVREQLRPDGAVGVDCRDIRALFDPPVGGAFIEGFLVVLTPRARQLDVTSVITARHRAGADPDVESIMVYEVNPKLVDPPPAPANQ
jgi:hypothetical protein